MTKAMKAIRIKQRTFLAVYRKCANITKSCQAAKINRASHYNWLRDYPAYVKEFAAAQDEAVEVMELEARRRAVHGTGRPVFYQGEEVGLVREYSDILLMFLLKGARPERYRERTDVQLKGQIEHGGKVHVYMPNNGRDEVDGNGN